MKRQHITIYSMSTVCAIMMSITAHCLFGQKGNWPYISAMAFCAGFISPLPFWWLLVVRKNHKNLAIGGIAGAISGFCFYYLLWIFYLWFGYICVYYFNGCEQTFSNNIMNPVNALWASAIYAVAGVIYTGIYTIPTFTITGIAVLFISNKFEKR